VRLFALAEVGFFVAVLLTSMIGHWIQAIAVVTAKQWTYGDEPQQSRTLLWALPIVLILHSGPWAIAAFLYFSWHVLLPHRAEWSGFFWGFGLALLLLALLMYRAHLQGRARSRPRARVTNAA